MGRAISLALSVYTYVNSPHGWGYRDLFMCSERYLEYILYGQWPKEALDQIGKEKGTDKGSDEALHMGEAGEDTEGE